MTEHRVGPYFKDSIIPLGYNNYRSLNYNEPTLGRHSEDGEVASAIAPSRPWSEILKPSSIVYQTGRLSRLPQVATEILNVS